MLQSLHQRRCKAGDYHNRHHHHHHGHPHHYYRHFINRYDSTDINVATKVFDFLTFILFHALSSPQVKFWPSPNSRPRKSSNPLCSNNKGATFGYFTFFNYSKALNRTRACVCKNFFCRPLKWTRMSPQGMILKRKSTRRRS